ncbi:hypothetical protein A2767_02500 [Candidatus Roizmanbacteria bacterium RIFCSPHIGHO2_01_FULL_35_10]|uniref:(d)CMP kinase n=1 Tax=Candidatus Roizmanbacteria bacterium RIFCSPLOWO2_01_FULL_35_13 TaxID=1802055 RepID=A0A1F7IAY5_9BACT|nr:MAG: hypothetical protein A2767_02500 [Candidatus Roizmanbacteria bacterium RIFCSPHIGHO2_01_FULL_35_10]OGK40519.1 MAG: hypothetical protein A3A74_02920 [Candidatus Roizmanbacteria bacterium RIFCSPLOWO2_01_FULL_35_13]
MKYSKITISGKICTGKTTLFWNLQKKLNWPVFSTSQYFRDLARFKKFSLEKAQEQNERTTKEVDFRVRDLLKTKGNLIAEGWMTGIMAEKLPRILKILLVCTDQKRIKRFSQREKISLTEAKKRITKREISLFDKLERIYNRRDFVNPKNYNLVVDTSELTPGQVLQTVVDKLI